MRANMIIEKGATDRRLVHIFIDYKSNRLVLQTGWEFGREKKSRDLCFGTPCTEQGKPTAVWD